MFHFQGEEWTFQQVEDYSNQVPFDIVSVCFQDVHGNKVKSSKLSCHFCDQVAHYFLSVGLGKGDTIAVFMENR